MMMISMMIFLLVDTVSVGIILESLVRSLVKILIQPVKIINMLKKGELKKW